MYKRQTRQTTLSLSDDNANRPVISNRLPPPPPLQQILSSLPQLALSLAILIFITSSYGYSLEQSGLWFYIACLSFFGLCAVFLYLQATHASYKNWQENPSTRRAIQLASLAGSLSFVGFHICFWSMYGWATPVFVSALFVLVFSILHILSALLIG